MQGTIEEGVLPGLLREIYVGRKSGTLQFLRGGDRYSVRFARGTIINVQTNVTEGRLGELLQKRGLVSAHDLARATEFVVRQKMRLGQALIQLGALDEGPARERDRPPRARQPRPRVLLERGHLRVRGGGGPRGGVGAHAQVLHRRAHPGSGARDDRSRRGALRPRRHRPRPPPVARPAPPLPEDHALPRGRLRAVAGGRHDDGAGSHPAHPPARGRDAAAASSGCCARGSSSTGRRRSVRARPRRGPPPRRPFRLHRPLRPLRPPRRLLLRPSRPSPPRHPCRPPPLPRRTSERAGGPRSSKPSIP